MDVILAVACVGGCRLFFIATCLVLATAPPPYSGTGEGCGKMVIGDGEVLGRFVVVVLVAFSMA